MSAAAAAVLVLVSCAGPTKFLDEEADLAYYERVGIIPFTSLAQDQLAGLKVTDTFFTELLDREFAQVVESGQFLAAMNRARGGTPVTNAWSTADLQRLAEETGIQGVFMGTVRDYTMERVGRESFPLLSMEVRLVDTDTGRVVWSGSRTRRGGPAFPIFGWGEIRTQGELTAKVCRELLDTLPRG